VQVRSVGARWAARARALGAALGTWTIDDTGAA
jgi:hypothetical protein